MLSLSQSQLLSALILSASQPRALNNILGEASFEFHYYYRNALITIVHCAPTLLNTITLNCFMHMYLNRFEFRTKGATNDWDQLRILFFN